MALSVDCWFCVLWFLLLTRLRVQSVATLHMSFDCGVWVHAGGGRVHTAPTMCSCWRRTTGTMSCCCPRWSGKQPSCHHLPSTTCVLYLTTLSNKGNAVAQALIHQMHTDVSRVTM